ncbi:MAG: hypothetical protein VKL39_22710 [Leptolyngbyaceae bacterium]|nr:hypothetical protein [Leptolyngbyaceae bacterium]
MRLSQPQCSRNLRRVTFLNVSRVAIAGIEMMVLVLASAIGSSLLAFCQTLFGNYRLGQYLCPALPLVIIFVLIPMRNPPPGQS